MLEAVKQWAFTLVITAAVGGIANFVVVSGRGNMKKYVKFACSAVALAVMVMPLTAMFREMPKIFDWDINGGEEMETYGTGYGEEVERINDLIIEKTNELLKNRIYDVVYEKTGIKPDGVYIYIGQKEDTGNSGAQIQAEVDVKKVIINMPEDTDNSKSEEIKSYLNELLNCGDVTVGISVGAEGNPEEKQ